MLILEDRLRKKKLFVFGYRTRQIFMSLKDQRQKSSFLKDKNLSCAVDFSSFLVVLKVS